MFNNANVLFRTKFVDGVSTVQRTVAAKHSKWSLLSLHLILVRGVCVLRTYFLSYLCFFYFFFLLIAHESHGIWTHGLSGKYLCEYINYFASNGLPPYKNMNKVVAYVIWTIFFSCFGLSWVMPGRVVCLLVDYWRKLYAWTSCCFMIFLVSYGRKWIIEVLRIVRGH